MQFARLTVVFRMRPAGISAADPSVGRLTHVVCALWLAGVAMRMTILAMPPVIPLVHDELKMSETQVGLLIGLPLALFALAAVPGSLLIARIGASRAVVLGMVIAALASASRGGAIDVTTLYAASIATGFGVAIMQPGMPTLVRAWLPGRVGLGTVAYTSGMLMGATSAPSLTIPYVLPLVGGSWRLDLAVWGLPAILLAPLFYFFSPAADEHAANGIAGGGRWWPDWRNPLVWILGIGLGSNNATYFSTNAFLGEYLASQGTPGLLGPALAWLNGFQVVALFILVPLANRMQRKAWPFLIFGPILFASFLVLIFLPSRLGIISAAALIGFGTAITLTATLALPALLSLPADVPRTAAGMFTISYTLAIIIPTISGALWDSTAKPWTVWLPICLSTVVMTALGIAATRYRPATVAPSP